mgnify:CR=1 FL=1
MVVEKMKKTLELLTLIGLGGFLGSVLRYITGTFFESFEAILLVNIIGSFFLGFILYEEVHVGVIPERARFALSVGFFPSLTTFSAFAVGIFSHPEFAFLFIFSNYILGFFGIYSGRSLALVLARGFQNE